MQKLFNKKGLTLIEMIVVMTIFFLLLVVIIEIYRQMINIKNTTEAKQTLIQESYNTLEKINIELKNYNIDYEEYFNRSVSACDGDKYGDEFIWDVNLNNNGYCDNFTSYGNFNIVSKFFALENTGEHQLYYCSSSSPSTDSGYFVLNNPLIIDGSGCYTALGSTGKQSFGEYALQFLDTKDDVDSQTGVVGDSDDIDLGIGPNAIYDADNIQELYLISQDQNRRMFFRRSLINSGDRNGDGIIGSGFEKLYTLQILKLKSFDAGISHDFNINNGGVYDGQIDTRACDYAEGFICNGMSIDPVLYSGYKLPLSTDDGWVNFLSNKITISDWNISVYPTKDPELNRSENNMQIQPYFNITFTTKLYGGTRQGKVPVESMNNFKLTLQTTFNTRSFYGK